MTGAVPMVEAREKDYVGAKIGMWLFLSTELLLFGGLFLIYAVYRSFYPQDFHSAAGELSRTIGAANTLVLLTSSLTMALSISAMKRGRTRPSLVFLLTTVLLGIVFLVVKGFEWGDHFHHGIYPQSPDLLKLGHGEILYFGLYYVMTGLHGVHVLIGLGVVGVMAAFVATGSIHKDDFVKLENTGLYWHFVDIIWIYLFPLFYLIT